MLFSKCTCGKVALGKGSSGKVAPASWGAPGKVTSGKVAPASRGATDKVTSGKVALAQKEKLHGFRVLNTELTLSPTQCIKSSCSSCSYVFQWCTGLADLKNSICEEYGKLLKRTESSVDIF